jgi:hypothetical protein
VSVALVEVIVKLAPTTRAETVNCPWVPEEFWPVSKMIDPAFTAAVETVTAPATKVAVPRVAPVAVIAEVAVAVIDRRPEESTVWTSNVIASPSPVEGIVILAGGDVTECDPCRPSRPVQKMLYPAIFRARSLGSIQDSVNFVPS